MDRNASPEQLEAQRRSQDRILVHNPTDQDYIEHWDRAFTNVAYVIPARTKDNGRGPGNAVLPRYIAENYVIHMCDKIVSEKLYEAIQKRNQDLRSKGESALKKWDSGQGDDELGFARIFLADKPAIMRDIIRQLWVRVDEEYGMNTPALEQFEHKETKDPYEFMYSVLDEKKTGPAKVEQTVSEETPAQQPQVPQEDLEQKKNDVIAQVS